MLTWMNTDMTASPTPLPETMMTSTRSLLRLKYWPIMRVAGSLVRPTPMPREIDIKEKEFNQTVGNVLEKLTNHDAIAEEQLVELASK